MIASRFVTRRTRGPLLSAEFFMCTYRTAKHTHRVAEERLRLKSDML